MEASSFCLMMTPPEARLTEQQEAVCKLPGNLLLLIPILQ
ncbi:MAG: hypothetical protein JWL81_1220 [Verrucomicrobiales bacterium]|nr:hypothetical protein [Verrucomicrobiales bacterium]